MTLSQINNYKLNKQVTTMATLDSIYNASLPILQRIPLIFTTRGAIVASFLTIYFAKFLQVQLSYILLYGYDLENPRSSKIAEKKGVNTWQVKAVARAKSGHENQWEAFIGFTAAMMVALRTHGSDNDELSKLANAFVIVRIAYLFVYILAFNVPLAVVRSAVWAVGLGIILRIFSISTGDIYL